MEWICHITRTAKAMVVFCMVCFGVTCNNLESHAQQYHPIELELRNAIFDTLRYYTNFTVEQTGKNDHWAIYRFNKLQKGAKGRAWCSDFILYGYHKNGVYPPLVTGVAYSWKKKKTLVYWPAMGVDVRRIKQLVNMMDVVVFTWSHVEGYTDCNILGPITIGGNTKGYRPKEGAYYPIHRRWRDVRGIYNHVTPWLKAHERSSAIKMSFNFQTL